MYLIIKALALFSGGLDSILSVRILQEQGIEVEVLHFISCFFSSSIEVKVSEKIENAALKLGVKLHVMDISKELSDIIRFPKFGYGKNLNPCLDCHALMLKKAKEFRSEIGADFIATGEVLGSRPFSQRKEAILLIEKEAGLEKLIVRPLSAQALPESIPEQKHWVDREKLLEIAGRSRRPQIALAEKFGIDYYPSPAGGCLLTDPGFSRRLKDLLKYQPNFEQNDAQLLKIGRHFRISPQVKVVVGRNQADNDNLASLAQENDYLMELAEAKGPLTLLRIVGEDTVDFQQRLKIAGGFTISHSKFKSKESVKLHFMKLGKSNLAHEMAVAPLAIAVAPQAISEFFEASPADINYIESTRI